MRSWGGTVHAKTQSFLDQFNFSQPRLTNVSRAGPQRRKEEPNTLRSLRRSEKLFSALPRCVPASAGPIRSRMGRQAL